MRRTPYGNYLATPAERRLMEELQALILEMEKQPGALTRYDELLDNEGICMGRWMRKLEIARGLLGGD